MARPAGVSSSTCTCLGSRNVIRERTPCLGPSSIWITRTSSWPATTLYANGPAFSPITSMATPSRVTDIFMPCIRSTTCCTISGAAAFCFWNSGSCSSGATSPVHWPRNWKVSAPARAGSFCASSSAAEGAGTSSVAVGAAAAADSPVPAARKKSPFASMPQSRLLARNRNRTPSNPDPTGTRVPLATSVAISAPSVSAV